MRRLSKATALALLASIGVTVSTQAQEPTLQQDRKGRIVTIESAIGCPEKNALAMLLSGRDTKNKAEQDRDWKLFGKGCRFLGAGTWLHRKLKFVEVQGIQMVCAAEASHEDCLWVEASRFALDGSDAAKRELERLRTIEAAKIVVEDTADTRFGKVEFVRDDNEFERYMRRSGETIYKANNDVLGLEKFYALSSGDLLVVADHCGGSGCSEEYRLIWFPADRDGALVDLGMLRSGTEFKAQQVADEIIFDLGFVDRKPLQARFSGGQISYGAKSGAPERLDAGSCDFLFTEVLDRCKQAAGNCARTVEKILFDGPMAYYRSWAAISQDPNLNQPALEKACRSACSGRGKPVRKSFAAAVCSSAITR